MHIQGRYITDNGSITCPTPKNLYNEKAPLAESAGGFGYCGNVFTSTSDPDYQTLLAAIRETAAEQNKVPRFNMPNFKPDEVYVEWMIRYGMLPAGFNVETDPINVYETDKKYFESHWWKPWPEDPYRGSIGVIRR